ncbi:MAG: esterase [Proteobacteria bacterium]|nr:esterase [Pseudomonadota bacterium]MBT4107718.1 esterase [Pseudomonadota bacterium]MBT4357420.1 esterase [Pseudomonadota bacterium]MBT4987527.1 esterase [Pseudomonadota bacterium]MBT5189944.1 esterase [Pseudomonadota bacterium]
MINKIKEALTALKTQFWHRREKLGPITDEEKLAEFITSRASMVGQTSLYGYIKTRAGTRFPELFKNDTFVVSINIAKWQIWSACVSDLVIYTGSLICREHVQTTEVRATMQSVVNLIFDTVGSPEEAGPDFKQSIERIKNRLSSYEFDKSLDLDAIFIQSPDALVHWSPIVDELKDLDEDIVRNSIRFRWQEPRRELRDALQVGPLMN